MYGRIHFEFGEYKSTEPHCWHVWPSAFVSRPQRNAINSRRRWPLDGFGWHCATSIQPNIVFVRPFALSRLRPVPFRVSIEHQQKQHVSALCRIVQQTLALSSLTDVLEVRVFSPIIGCTVAIRKVVQRTTSTTICLPWSVCHAYISRLKCISFPGLVWRVSRLE